MTNEDELIYWIWLTQIRSIGPVAENRLLERYKDPRLLYEISSSADALSDAPINRGQIENIVEARSLDAAKKIEADCRKYNIFLLPKNSDRYPLRAKTEKDAPILLYCKGTLKELDKTVGIIGARRCSQVIKNMTADITYDLMAEGNTIISGMAKGVDSYAHTVCIINDGYTVAVLGNGLDICYPKEHEKLMQSIAEKGLLLSEYPPGTQPSRYSFPARNRIISYWSDRLIVIGAGRNSGSNITAKYAEKSGRVVVYI